MSNRTDIVVETDNAEGQVLLSASRVYDLTEDKTQDTINSEVRNTLNQLAIRGTTQGPFAAALSRTWVSCTGLTANHVVANWGLTVGTPNNPPADITIEEGADGYYLTIENWTASFSFTPVFILPQTILT